MSDCTKGTVIVYLFHRLFLSPIYLFFLFVSCLLFFCLSVSITRASYSTLAAPSVFCITKDMAMSASVSTCGLWRSLFAASGCVLTIVHLYNCTIVQFRSSRSELPVLVESWYWFLVFQNIVGTWDVHYRWWMQQDWLRCVEQMLLRACVRACLFIRFFICLFVCLFVFRCFIAARKARCGVWWIQIWHLFCSLSVQKENLENDEAH